MTMNHLFHKLRKQNKGQYLMLGFCIFLSVLLVNSFALMYYSPTVQEFLPRGGDTRKMASLLIVVTCVGCIFFTLYASALFFRFKSREYGIFLAMGTPKIRLKPIIYKELILTVSEGALLGFLFSVPVSWLIWKLFSTFLVSTAQMQYRFGPAGFGVGLLFAVILTLCLFLNGRRFVNRTNIMEILRAGHKTEMVKLIPAWTGKLGIVMCAAGLAVSVGVPSVSASAFHYLMPSYFNLTFLIPLAGLYLFLLSAVSQANAAHNKKKYYRNLIHISMMRFTAKATVKNMCVIVLLLFCSLFAVFFGMQYSDSRDIGTGPNSSGFSIHYPLQENQIKKEDIDKLAEEYQMEITDYGEAVAANLVISYRDRDLSDDNQYFEVDHQKSKLSLFLSEDLYTALTGRGITVEKGTHKVITPTDYRPSIYNIEDGLYEAANPDTGLSVPLAYGGSVEYDSIYYMSNNPYVYVLSNSDYRDLTKSISSSYLERLILFDVADEAASYPFASALLEEYVARATDLSNHMGLYDAWEAGLAAKEGRPYGYEGQTDLSTENTMLLSDWKYKPEFTIITRENYLQTVSVYVMFSFYIFVITLAATAIMCYVRSVSTAAENKGLFDSLQRLGADQNYCRRILRTQLMRLFRTPAAAGCGAGYLFAVLISFFNDKRFTSIEYRNLAALLGMILVILCFLYLIYRKAGKKAEEIVGIH